MSLDDLMSDQSFSFMMKDKVKHAGEAVHWSHAAGWRDSYLVFKIFKNCNISENWISLKALKNLNPAWKSRSELETWRTLTHKTSQHTLNIRSHLWTVHPCLTVSWTQLTEQKTERSYRKTPQRASKYLCLKEPLRWTRHIWTLDWQSAQHLRATFMT